MREKVTSLFLHPVVGLTILAIAVFISTFFVSIEGADPSLPETNHSLNLKITPTPSVKIQPVVVALRRIQANTRVTTSAIGLRFFPESSDSPPGVLFTKQDAVGKLAKLEIPAGQVILQSMLTTTQLWGKSVYPAVAGDFIFYTREHHLYAIDAKTGEEIWHYEPKGKDWSLTSPPVATADLVYYAVVFPDHFPDRAQVRLYAVEVQTGRVRWSFTHQDVTRREDVPPLAPVVGEGIVCFVSWGNQDLYGFDAEIGYKKWQFNTDELISAPSIANGTVSFISSDGYLYNLDVQTGQEKWRVEQK